MVLKVYDQSGLLMYRGLGIQYIKRQKDPSRCWEIVFSTFAIFSCGYFWSIYVLV